MPKRKLYSSSSCNPHLWTLVLMIVVSVTWNIDRMMNHQTLFLQEELVRDSPLDSPFTKNEKSKLESKLKSTHHNQNRQLEATTSTNTTSATNAISATATSKNSSAAPTLITPPNNLSPNPSIKSWGCSRTETPLIFVHIGKAGGGSIRMQLALAAQNYTRKNDHWKKPKLDDHYYPMQSTSDDDKQQQQPRRGRFCHSTYANSHWVAPVVSNDKILKNNITQQHTPFSYRLKSFDGLKYCNATTPFGMAIACPTNYQSKIRKKQMYMSTLCETCDDEYYIEKEFYKIHLHKSVSEEPEDIMSKHSTRKNLGPVRANVVGALEKLAKPPPPGHTCDMVYTAHNYLGAELNWLPPRYLKEHWWDHSEWKEPSDNKNNKNENDDDNSPKKSLEDYWNSLLRDRTDRRKEAFEFLQTQSNMSSLLGGASTIDMDRLSAEIAASTNDDKNNQHRWCPNGYNGHQYDRPKQVLGPLDPWDKSRSLYENCGLPIARAADAAFRKSLGKNNENNSNSNTMLASLHNANYAPIYSSLPVHRVTMLREPFSWLLSRFFWNTENSNNTVCDNFSFPSLWNPSLSWIEYYSLEFLFSLCGNECRVRYEHHMIDIDGIAAQASSNLKISFSVVGLLNETDSFYEMLQKRIRYIHRSDKTDLGPKHKSTHPDKDRCSALYKEEDFREKVRASSPALVALEGVYRVGVQVNQFQKQELERCE